jgi:iron(III) transport system substrate-binding protein
VLAQLAAEKANPKSDVWFGGGGDTHVQAGAQDLLAVYKSPTLPKLQPWAQQIAEASGHRTGGVYLGVLGISYNPEVLASKKLPVPKCWKDLAKPEYRGEVQTSNANSSSTSYTHIATLVQMMGEEQAFDYLKSLHKNVSEYTRSGAGGMKNAARGENAVAIGFVHDAVAAQIQKLPIKYSMPCEGTGYEIGAMSIVKGARNEDNAKKFYEWALTPAAQELAAASMSFQLPSNKSAKLPEQMAALKDVKLIKYDVKKYGSKEQRTRLVARWENEIASQPSEAIKVKK